MGAWGNGPLENDTALDWLAAEVETPLLAAVQKALRAYLEEPERDDVKLIEAEAAAAFLVDLAGSHTKYKYLHLNDRFLEFEATQLDLWSLAIRVIERIVEDQEWLNDWNEPLKKKQVLQQILMELQQLKAGNTHE